MIKRLTTILIATLIVTAFPVSSVHATPEEVYESVLMDHTESIITPEDELFTTYSQGHSILTDFEQAYGSFNADGSFTGGALGKVKLKPSDKKRLIRIANGSLSDAEKEYVTYDTDLINLLYKLTTPKELGGGGLTHLRVGDLLRFKHDPRSKETENTDNISQHQFGKAADILEINKTHCTKESFFGSEDLPPFPVKVAWQGGAPRNPTADILGSFDAVARANAMRDILGALPADSYNGSIQGLEDLLQQLQRRVLADELELDRASLDFLSNNDTLETLGRAITNKHLGLTYGALIGSTQDEMLRSIARAPIEAELNLPPGSLAGNTIADALYTAGLFKIAYEIGIDPKDLRANPSLVGQSAYYQYYRETERAFQLPTGTLDGLRSGQADAYRAVGAALLASRLRYSPSESDALVRDARAGTVKRLSLARYGAMPLVQGDPLLILAPSNESSKAAGERYLANEILKSKTSVTFDALPESIRNLFSDTSILQSPNRGDMIRKLSVRGDLNRAFRTIGAAAMEEVFDLPEDSYTAAVREFNDPSMSQLAPILGQRLLEDYAKARPGSFRITINIYRDYAKVDEFFRLPSGTTAQLRSKSADFKKVVGETYLKTVFIETFKSLYQVGSVGIASLTLDEMYSVFTGKVTPAATRAGASWVEEDLGLTPDSFSSLFAIAPAENRLVNAGMAVVAGYLFDAFDVDGQNVTTGADFIQTIGQARVETALGLVPGTFRESLDAVKDANSERFDTIFADNDTVDTILGVPAGTAEQFKNKQLTPADVAKAVGQLHLTRLDTEDLQNKFGWDGRYRVDGEKMLRTITSSDGTTKDVDSGKVVALRDLLAQIGGYSSDYAFGYEAGTMRQWNNASSETERNAIILAQGAKLYAQRLGLDLEDHGALLASYQGDIPSREAVLAAFKKRLNLPSIEIPASDIQSIVSGDMPAVHYALATANQVQQTALEIERKYNVLRALVSGWSGDDSQEAELSTESLERYARVLADYAIFRDPRQVDKTFERITKGVLSASGLFSDNATPYEDNEISGIKLGYFATKEARNNYFYGAIDAAIKKRDGSLPEDFSKTLLEGSNADRSLMLFDYIEGKVNTDATLVGLLPSDIQPIVKAWLATQDSNQGAVLAENPDFTKWAGNLLAQTIGTELPPQAIKIATQYASGVFDPKVLSISADEEYAHSIEDIGIELGTQWVGQQVGLPGQFGEYYDKYQQVQQLYTDYQSGTMDTGQAIFAVDALLFDGKLAEFTHSIDDALGLPPGSSQLLIQFAITGNPIYLAQFVFNLFFGVTIECPDLQDEARKNVKTLISAMIDIGEAEPNLAPSQIITYSAGYVQELASKLKQVKVYAHCLTEEGSRCGVFARPEYADRVHIGF